MFGEVVETEFDDFVLGFVAFFELGLEFFDLVLDGGDFFLADLLLDVELAGDEEFRSVRILSRSAGERSGRWSWGARLWAWKVRR